MYACVHLVPSIGLCTTRKDPGLIQSLQSLTQPVATETLMTAYPAPEVKMSLSPSSTFKRFTKAKFYHVCCLFILVVEFILYLEIMQVFVCSFHSVGEFVWVEF